MKKKLLISAISLLMISSVFAYGVLDIGFLKIKSQSDSIDLCYKDADSGWTCVEDGKPTGKVTYEQISEGILKVHLEATGLDPDYVYQLTLNGQGDGNNDGCNLDYNNYVDGVLSMQSADPWMSGCWNNNEGWFNFRMTEAPEAKETKGHWEKQQVEKCYTYRGKERCYTRWNKVYVPGETVYQIDQDYEIPLPEGIYKNVKFLVKRTTGLDGHGGDFQAVLMEKEHGLNFIVLE